MKPKTYPKVPSQALDRFKNRSGLSNEELAELFGYSAQSINRYLKTSKMPNVLEHAINGFGAESAKPRMIAISGKNLETIQELAQQLGLNVMEVA